MTPILSSIPPENQQAPDDLLSRGISWLLAWYPHPFKSPRLLLLVHSGTIPVQASAIIRRHRKDPA